MNRFERWVEATHSTGFELRRHFLARFFDSDLVTTPGQWRVVAGSAAGIVASVILLVTQSYYGKYLRLLEMDSPNPFRLAMLADHLFFVTIAMLLTGLFTALLWPSLFPGLRDYMALAGLPVKARQIFIAKFTALLLLSSAFIAAVNLLPSLMLPAVSNGRYQEHALISALTLFIAATLAAFFVFFVLVALEGVLLNVTPPQWFPAVSLGAQGILLVALLCALPFALTIPGLYWAMDLRPSAALWAPPAWFLAIDQRMLGNREPFAAALAARAWIALAGSASAAVTAYLWSYRRHRVRLLETPLPENRDSRMLTLLSRIADKLMADPPERAVFAFMAKALARSPRHRLVLTIYAGVAVAIVASAFLSLMFQAGFRGFAVRTDALRHTAVSAPLALSLFLVSGYRYLYRLPVELRANWIFQVNEGENRRAFLSATDRFVAWFGLYPLFLLTLPLEVTLLGWRDGVAAAALASVTALILRELMLYQFQKIPFTCAYLPGKRNLLETLLLYGAGVAIYISTLSAFFAWCILEPSHTLTVFGLLLAGWAWFRAARIDDSVLGAIEYEEEHEPAVHTLAIDADW
ncbi:MAG: hypothetical protein R2729_15410 [Bryobacteraceae bacterium]